MPVTRSLCCLPWCLPEQLSPSKHSCLRRIHTLLGCTHLLFDNNNPGSYSPGQSRWYRKLLLVFLLGFGHPGWGQNLSNLWLLYGEHIHGPTTERKMQSHNQLLSSQRLVAVKTRQEFVLSTHCMHIVIGSKYHATQSKSLCNQKRNSRLERKLIMKKTSTLKPYFIFRCLLLNCICSLRSSKGPNPAPKRVTPFEVA